MNNSGLLRCLSFRPVFASGRFLLASPRSSPVFLTACYCAQWLGSLIVPTPCWLTEEICTWAKVTRIE